MSLRDHFSYDIKIIKTIEKYIKLYSHDSKLSKRRSKFIYNSIKRRNSCIIAPEASFGKNICIVHPQSITIGKSAHLGNNIILYQGVQIIANFAKHLFDETKNPKHQATIGDNVILCANCIIIGNINIGNNCIIGAGAIVTKSVPDNSMVVGVNVIRPNNYDNSEIVKRLTTKSKTLFFEE